MLNELEVLLKMSKDHTNWCLGYLKGLEIMSIHKEALTKEIIKDLKQIEWLTNNKNVDMTFFIKKWEERLK